MSSIRVVLDLDGTLLDSSRRHYEVYLVLAKRFDIQPLPFSTYWNHRRSRRSNLEVLMLSGLNGSEKGRAEQGWSNLIESPHMLINDKLLPSVRDWLDRMHLIVDFVLVTLRSNESALENQLELLDISNFFLQVMVVPNQNNAAMAKVRAVQEARVDGVIAWIGDTETDMKAAELIGTRGIGVTSGIRSSDALREAGALEIYQDVTQIDFSRSV